MKTGLSILFFLCIVCVQAQDVNTLLKEASNYEKQLNESEALKRYMQATELDAGNVTALVKCAEINSAIGSRQKDINAKTGYYNTALSFAQKAYAADTNSADAGYAVALAAAKMTEVEDKNKEVVALVRQSKIHVDKALAVNANHAKANYTLGKWHYEMVKLSLVKKAAVKALYGGLPKGDIDSAIYYMEKCRGLDQYFVRNYLDLAKAYEYNNRAEKELEILSKLVKLPNRTPDDAALKAEGQKMLDSIR